MVSGFANNILQQITDAFNNMMSLFKDPIAFVQGQIAELYNSFKGAWDAFVSILQNPMNLFKIILAPLQDYNGCEQNNNSSNSTSQEAYCRAKVLGIFSGNQVADAVSEAVQAGGAVGIIKVVTSKLSGISVFNNVSKLVNKTVSWGKNKLDITLKKIGNKIGFGGSDAKRLARELDDEEFKKTVDKVPDPKKKERLEARRNRDKLCNLIPEKTGFNILNLFSINAYAGGINCGIFGSRSEAFNKAKQDLGIPSSQQPVMMKVKENGVELNPPLTDQFGNKIKDPKTGQPIRYREYEYTLPDGKKIYIQEHSIGHSFPDGGVVEPHFNLRPAEDRRNGTIPGLPDHYFFESSK